MVLNHLRDPYLSILFRKSVRTGPHPRCLQRLVGWPLGPENSVLDFLKKYFNMTICYCLLDNARSYYVDNFNYHAAVSQETGGTQNQAAQQLGHKRSLRGSPWHHNDTTQGQGSPAQTLIMENDTWETLYCHCCWLSVFLGSRSMKLLVTVVPTC